MTRADFIRGYDRRMMFPITSQARVRASSATMHRAFRGVCPEPGIRDRLDATIESLGETRELVAKGLARWRGI